MTFTATQIREAADTLQAAVAYDDQPETHVPANWILTAIDDEGGYGVAVIAVDEEMTTPELAQMFGDIAADKGATHGHGLNPITEETVFFGQTIEQITNHANDYAKQERRQARKAGKGKGFA